MADEFEVRFTEQVVDIILPAGKKIVLNPDKLTIYNKKITKYQMADVTEKKPLWQDILQFSRNKNKMAVGFISLGIVGLALPVIPG